MYVWESMGKSSKWMAVLQDQGGAIEKEDPFKKLLEVSHWLGGMNLSVTGWQNQGGWWFNQERRCLYIYIYSFKNDADLSKENKEQKGRFNPYPQWSIIQY